MAKKANGPAMAGRSSSAAAQHPGTTTAAPKLVVEVPATYAVRLPPPTTTTTTTATSALAYKLQSQQQHHRSGGGGGRGVAVAEIRNRAPAPVAPGASMTVPFGAGSSNGSPKLSPFTGQGSNGERGFAPRPGSGGSGGDRRPRRRPQTSTGSRAACPNIVELSPLGLAAVSTNANSSPMSQYSPTRKRPSTSPRKLAGGGGGRGGGSGGSGGGRGRRGDTIAPELVMTTVSFCLGGDDDDADDFGAGLPATTTPDDHHRFTGGTGRFSHYFTNQASPASLLLAKKAAAAAASASSTVNANLRGKVLASGVSGAVDNGGGGFGGRGDDCIRPAEPATASGVDETAARSHGFRRWRPGENGADALTGGGQAQRPRIFP